MRLYLNIFRGEPAISEFVWHITSTHSSSSKFCNISTVRASTQSIRLSFTLAMGSSPGFGPNPSELYALFRLAFATASGVTPLTLPLRRNSQDSFSKRHAVRHSGASPAFTRTPTR